MLEIQYQSRWGLFHLGLSHSSFSPLALVPKNRFVKARATLRQRVPKATLAHFVLLARIRRQRRENHYFN